jgi:hypothetical protein
MSVEALKAKKRLSDRRNKAAIRSKQIEFRLEKELESNLNELLANNDRVLLEISPKAVPEFLNILTGRLLLLYEYEQVDQNKFIFYEKEISL